MWRTSVLLPQPLPPMMKKILPRGTSKLRSRITTKSPNAIVRSRTVMRASPCAILDVQHVGQDGEEAVRDDDPHDAQDDGRRRGLPDGGGVLAGANALHAAADRDDDPEDQALRDPERDVCQGDRLLALL